MKRLAVLLTVLGLICVGCGQFAGVDAPQAQPPAAAAAGGLEPVAVTTTPGQAGQSGATGDQPQASGPGVVQGNALSVDGASQPAPQPANTKSGKGKAPAPRQKGKGGSKPTSKSQGRQPAPATSPTSGGAYNSSAKSISKITTKYAQHNAAVLPSGYPFVICPVQGRYTYSDDFGAPRCVSNEAYCGGYHLHMGNDMLASLGTPIVAPFDGRAVKDVGLVGGNGVIVYGPQGYVYNAHLVAFGHLGQVKAGEVIGFVGNTGDAAGGPTNDHFEWHPKVTSGNFFRSAYGQTLINGAVDPYPFLHVVCPPG